MTVYLLDTCTLIWQATGQTAQISPTAGNILIDPGSRLALSTVSFMEIAFKVSAGRPAFSAKLAALEHRFASGGHYIYPINAELMDAFAVTPLHHPDPFDRLIALTALRSNATILSPDTSFDAYGASRVW